MESERVVGRLGADPHRLTFPVRIRLVSVEVEMEVAMDPRSFPYERSTVFKAGKDA